MIFPVVDVFIKDVAKFVAWRISSSEQIGMIQALFAIFHSVGTLSFTRCGLLDWNFIEKMENKENTKLEFSYSKRV
jgi:hypothetical protein